MRGVETIVTGLAAVGALLAASCCVLPLALTLVGVGGSWLVVLAPFTVHRELILAIVAIVVGALWWHLRRPARRTAVRMTLTSIATLALGLALTRSYWEAATMQVLWSAWRHG